MTKLDAYLIECRTGCSCCSGENHYRGPFKTLEEAESRKKSYIERRILSSQYSDTGNYDIEKHEAEQLPDGRLIINNRVCGGFAEDTYEDFFYEHGY